MEMLLNPATAVLLGSIQWSAWDLRYRISRPAVLEFPRTG
jgi:hypothetical protein